MENKSITRESAKPKVLEVAQILRDRGLRFHPLWDKSFDRWVEKDFEELEQIRLGNFTPENPKAKRKEYNDGQPRKRPKGLSNVARAVVRIEDDVEFKSIAECSRKEGVHISTLCYMLKNNNRYKYKS